MTTQNKPTLGVFGAFLLMVPVCAFMLMSFSIKTKMVELQTVSADHNITVQNVPDIAPVDFTKVTKVVPYGEILDPRTNRMRKHTGIDFELNLGSDVVATAEGVVVMQEYGEKQGNFVLIRHDKTFSTRYFHLETAKVKVGDAVRKGQVIGLVGSTGIFSTGPHLHYEILKDYTTIDPASYLPAFPEVDEGTK